jgi:adenylate cyclase
VERDGAAPPPRGPKVRDAAAPRWRNLAIGGLAAALVAPLLFTQPVRLLEARLFDILSTIEPARPPQPGAVIVTIDEPSFQEIGQRWPWPRSLHAELVGKLRAAGARVIGLDIIFAEPSTEAADGALAAAVGADTVLAADVVTTQLDQGVQTTRVNPIDPLLDAGAAPGVTAVALDPDAYLRRMPETAEGFAAEILRRAGEPVAAPPPGALIQYFGPPRSYPTVSYYQALDPDAFLPPGRFKDQIVLVGLSLQAPPSAGSGSPDTFPTPYTLATETLTAGVEVQATVLDNLRHGLFVVPLSAPAMAGIVLAAALLAGGLAGRRTTWRSAVAAAASVAVLVGGAWLLLRYGRLWAPPAGPVAAVLTVFGARAGLDFAAERRLRRQVSEAFSRYLSPDLVAELARDPSSLRLGGERRNLTVLFCDVRGFTTLSERLKNEPEQLTALINRLLDALSGAVMAEGGTIDKYMGDCVMAFWNAPLPAPDHAERAARAALGMIAAVERLNEELREESGGAIEARFAVGVGINTGDCVVGNVGSRWRYDYSVLGDTVNHASRLEGLSKEYGVSVILGPETAERIREHHVTVELDRVAVRGKTEATPIHTIVAPAARRAEPALAELAGLQPRFLASLHAGSRMEAMALADVCRRLEPSLAGYYDKMLARLDDAAPEARRLAS